MAEQLITSRDNGRLMAARRVRDGRDKFRIFIEGRRLAEEAAHSGLKLTECFLSEDFDDPALVASINAPTFRMTEKVFKTVADTDSPQGIILVAERPSLRPFTKTLLPMTLFLNEINNPSNLGAILRTAEAAGVGHVVLSQGSTDPYSPKALRASMGSAFRISIEEGESLAQAVAVTRERGGVVTGADIEGSISYLDADWSKPRMLVFGSEAHGLSSEDKALLDEMIHIPMSSDVESLNLAVSAGVILFEARRQLTV
ncbi:MAG TPA: RNA methyltransferase [Pyrinomonadaceae bacterium]|jgi:TrmH family RNA methyltransferase|nr:RNA methyltransferase [Pyrinomonadaceae bacterium]